MPTLIHRMAFCTVGRPPGGRRPVNLKQSVGWSGTCNIGAHESPALRTASPPLMQQEHQQLLSLAGCVHQPGHRNFDALKAAYSRKRPEVHNINGTGHCPRLPVIMHHFMGVTAAATVNDAATIDAIAIPATAAIGTIALCCDCATAAPQFWGVPKAYSY